MVTKTLLRHISGRLEEAVKKNAGVKNIQQVHGGDINQTYMLQTSAGKFFLKVNNSAPPLMFEKESNGLGLLKSANALAVPAPIATGVFEQAGFLVMEWVERGRPRVDFWQQFGYGLAGLHRQTSPFFGLGEDNYIGSITQSNAAAPTWAAFYAQCRIMPLARQAFDQQKFSLADVRAVEELCGKLDVIFPQSAPSLLHGDLWSGNFLAGEEGQPVIFDPAVYYGHREMDIAITLLFGGFDNKFYDFYNEAWPLAPGWRQRTNLCQLYPVLVHLLLFGGHYYTSAGQIIRRYA